MVSIYRNEDIIRIVAFIPPGHKHVRLLIEAKDQSILLQEATTPAIDRAYVNVTTHPTRRVVELTGGYVDSGKNGYARYQLIESGRGEDEVLAEVLDMLEQYRYDDA
jgi:hypothetical protein